MKILFTGDINFRGHTNLTLEKSKNILSEIIPIAKNSDYIIPNLECPLADHKKHKPIYKSGPNLIAGAENICFLKALHANVVMLANNHIGDFGSTAIKETIQLLETNHMQYAGAGRNIVAAYQAARIEKDGIKASILSVCENEFGMATETTPGSAGFSPRRLMNQIKTEKQYSDYVIVVFHGGNEHNPLPSPDTVERYRFICDMGADSLIATHPHCPQGYEVYNGKPIVYSMGNFLFRSAINRDSNDAWYYGYLSLLDIEENIVLNVLPYKFNRNADKIQVFNDDSRSHMMKYIDRLSGIIQNRSELENYFKGWAWSHQWYPLPPQYFETLESFNAAGHYNLARCEAHVSQFQALFEIFYKNEMKLAADMSEKIIELQKMPV